MIIKEKVDFIVNTLNDLYPEPEIPLDHRNNFTFLVAVMLSAQSTDKKVNQITPYLFSIADTAKKMIKLSVEEIRNIIREIGLAPTKAKNIRRTSELLISRYNGVIPQTFQELESLPGVGHKTASVIISQAFGKPTFPVDTHIHRLAYRWGLSDGKNVVKTENDLKKIFKKKHWSKLHLQMIFYGREYCKASKNRCLCYICEKTN